MKTAEDERGAFKVGELLLRSPQLREARIAELEVRYAAARAEVERLEPGAQAEGMARVEYVHAQDRAQAILRVLKWVRATRRGKLAYVVWTGLGQTASLVLGYLLISLLFSGKLALVASPGFWRDQIFQLVLVPAGLWLGLLNWKSEERAYNSLLGGEKNSG